MSSSNNLRSFSLRNIKAETVAQKLFHNVLLKYGIPQKIHSDQGTQFESALFRSLCSLLGIEKTRTSPYHPQCDGLVERANRTIQEMLTAYAADTKDDWDAQLPHIQFAYNTSEHSLTGFSPYYLMFGRDPHIPPDIVAPIPHEASPNSPAQHALTTLDRLHDAFAVVRNRMDQRHRAAKRMADRQKPVQDIAEKTAVWLYTVPPPGESPKLHRHWTGPWLVREKVGQVNYKIEHPTTKRARIVHCSRLKPVAASSTLPNFERHTPSPNPRTSRSFPTRAPPTFVNAPDAPLRRNPSRAVRPTSYVNVLQETNGYISGYERRYATHQADGTAQARDHYPPGKLGKKVDELAAQVKRKDKRKSKKTKKADPEDPLVTLLPTPDNSQE